MHNIEWSGFLAAICMMADISCELSVLECEWLGPLICDNWQQHCYCQFYVELPLPIFMLSLCAGDNVRDGYGCFGCCAVCQQLQEVSSGLWAHALGLPPML